MNARELMQRAERLVQEFTDALGRFHVDVQDLRNEFALRRRLPSSDIVWDQHVTLTKAAGGETVFDLLKDTGKIGVAATVLNATTGAELGINGSEPVPVFAGDDFDKARIATIRLANKNGVGELKVLVFLAETKAAGVGAWA